MAIQIKVFRFVENLMTQQDDWWSPLLTLILEGYDLIRKLDTTGSSKLHHTHTHTQDLLRARAAFCNSLTKSVASMLLTSKVLSDENKIEGVTLWRLEWSIQSVYTVHVSDHLSHVSHFEFNITATQTTVIWGTVVHNGSTNVWLT